MIQSRLSASCGRDLKLYRWVCQYADCMIAETQSSGPWGFSQTQAIGEMRKHMKEKHPLD